MLKIKGVTEKAFRDWALNHNWILMEEKLDEESGDNGKKNGTQLWMAPTAIAAIITIKDGEIALGGRKE